MTHDPRPTRSHLARLVVALARPARLARQDRLSGSVQARSRPGSVARPSSEADDPSSGPDFCCLMFELQVRGPDIMAFFRDLRAAGVAIFWRPATPGPATQLPCQPWGPGCSSAAAAGRPPPRRPLRLRLTAAAPSAATAAPSAATTPAAAAPSAATTPQRAEGPAAAVDPGRQR